MAPLGVGIRSGFSVDVSFSGLSNESVHAGKGGLVATKDQWFQKYDYTANIVEERARISIHTDWIDAGDTLLTKKMTVADARTMAWRSL